MCAPVKNGGSALNIDLGPLRQAIPALERMERASWTSGTLGDDRLPGRATYWVDAVVQLDPEMAVQARALADTPSEPVVHPTLERRLPSATFLTSPKLDQLFGGPNWWATAHLVEGRPILVLNLVGR